MNDDGSLAGTPTSDRAIIRFLYMCSAKLNEEVSDTTKDDRSTAAIQKGERERETETEERHRDNSMGCALRF